MVDRIRILLESRKLSPTQFADLIAVARPIVSHILSGRNKPSLEVVQRILVAIPELSMPWLLNGSGPMLTGPVSVTPPAIESSKLIDNRLDNEIMLGEEVAVDRRQMVKATGPSTTVRNPKQDDAKSHGAQLTEPQKSGQTTPLTQLPPVKQLLVQPNQRFNVSRRSATGAGILSATLGAAEPVMPSSGPETSVPLTPVDSIQSVSSSSGKLPATSLNSGQNKADSQLGRADADGTQLAAIHPSLGPIETEKGFEPAVKAVKGIRRIIIFYHDGSFSDYQPE